MSWREDASCRLRPELPWVTDRPTPSQVAEMLDVCAACPVRCECFADMKARGDMVGIRAGLRWVSEAEPAKARPARRQLFACEYCAKPYIPKERAPNSRYCSAACGRRERRRRGA